jgi:hypothetical protein
MSLELDRFGIEEELTAGLGFNTTNIGIRASVDVMNLGRKSQVVISGASCPHHSTTRIILLIGETSVTHLNGETHGTFTGLREGIVVALYLFRKRRTNR